MRAHSSDIKLVTAESGEAFPCAPSGSVLSSSVPLGWRGIIVEWHRLEPQELPEHSVVGHGLAVHIGKRPISFGWKHGSQWTEGQINPGESHLLTHGELNAPRWLETFEEISLVLDRNFVADIVSEGLPADRIELVTQRSVPDPTIVRYAEAFRSELLADGANGLLYADTLAVGFALHLLSQYAAQKPKLPQPKGKLNSFQLRTVVDFIQAHLDEDLSLLTLADRANVSPFHFARQFRKRVGLPPHQFVLRQRVQKSLGLLKLGAMPLGQIAVDCGFHDQPHFTHAFRKVLGTTPAMYAARR
jgi:AraC family transcriptional regulator